MTRVGGTTSRARRALLDALVAKIEAVRRGGQPTLVGVQGRSAAGKTSLADELHTALATRGVPTLRSSIDDFHPPGHKYRSIERQYTAQTYYSEGYAYDDFRRCVITPLRDDGDRVCQAALWNSADDVPANAPWIRHPDNVVAIVDGAFLLHPTLADAWDLSIWLDIDFDTMVERAVHRDVAWVGSADVVRRKYLEVWIPAHRYFEALTNAPARCDVVIDNCDIDRPQITRASR